MSIQERCSYGKVLGIEPQKKGLIKRVLEKFREINYGTTKTPQPEPPSTLYAGYIPIRSPKE